jgi:hypothetical protein
MKATVANALRFMGAVSTISPPAAPLPPELPPLPEPAESTTQV